MVSDKECAPGYTDGKIVAITRSACRATTTKEVHHSLTEDVLKEGVRSDHGTSFGELDEKGQHNYYVLEISSFQLDDVVSFKPYIAVLLNITPDHLDQYDNKLESYARSKFRITENQSHENYFVYNFDDNQILELIKNINTKA